MTSNDLRRRKLLKDQNGRHVPHKKRKEAPSSTIHRSFLCLILSATILTVFILLYIDRIPWYLGHKVVDHIARNFGYYSPVHAVVIDAGSTGSRVLAFTFHESYYGGHLILDKELYEYNKRGLSSFADSPQKGVESIAKLLEKAKQEIPKEYWHKTPLILRATAGLRLLPSGKADDLLNLLKKFFHDSPFLTNRDSVAVMNGTDEGIFSWFTVNFLLERIYGNPEKTVAALDLGGGSTQVTFSARTPASLSQKESIHQAATPSGPISVYTHSFLGLGLKAARKAIFTLNQPHRINVTSECVNHIIKARKFHFGGKDYYISGPETNYPTSKDKGDSSTIEQEIPIVNFRKCSEIVSDYVQSMAKPPEELKTKQIFAFSYYFDRATEVGLIDIDGGQITVNDFKTAAEKTCHYPNADQPFMCLDLTFIWILLEKALGVKNDTKLYLFKKIKGYELSWALGAAYNLLRG